MLDTEWSMATANSFGSYLDTAHVWVYMAGSWSQATNSDLFNQMLTDGHARVFTTSWSCTEDTGCTSTAINAWHAIFNSMIGQGWTLMTASGDRGSTDDCYFNNPAHTSVAYPASDPDVVGVGGTSLTLNASGNWDSEPAWQGGSRRLLRATITAAAAAARACTSPAVLPGLLLGGTGRLVPDISLNAWGQPDRTTTSTAGSSPTGGTSISSPEMAGFFAQENAYLLASETSAALATTPPAAHTASRTALIYRRRHQQPVDA